MTGNAHTPHRRRWYNPRALMRALLLRPKLIAGIAVAGVMLALLPGTMPHAIRATMAWVAGGSVYLGLALWQMASSGADHIRKRARRQDESAVAILLIILAAIAASFLAIAGVLALAKSADGVLRVAYLALAGATIFVSWSVTQFAFTFHYAHEFYAPSEAHRDAESGLEFPHDEAPDYWDFLYFSTAIGATSQTSDTGIRAKTLRRLVTLHAIVSFFFNTMVLALTINLAAGLV